jgi:hypothetical protein
MPTNGARYGPGGKRARTAGAWPHWVRYWETSTGGLRRDLMIDRAYLELMVEGNLKPGQVVADRFGTSRTSVHRARARVLDWLSPEGWPPAIPHGFGLSADARRRARLSAMGYAVQADGEALKLAPEVEEYQVRIPDVTDEDGQEWASWQG